MAPEQSVGTPKGLRVKNLIVSCVLKSNFLDHRHVLVPVAAAVTMKHRENVAVIRSNNSFIFQYSTCLW